VRRTRRRGIGHEAEGGLAVVLVVLIILVMGGSGWVAAYAGANGKVPRGTSVGGIDIGGRDRYAASAALAQGFHRQAQQPITVTVGTFTTQVAPEDAGLTVDSVATVAKVLGPRSWDPRRLWRYYTGGDETTPVVDIDERRMNTMLDLLDEQAGQPARNAGISLAGGQVALTRPRDGAQLDREAAAGALVDAFENGHSAVQLPLTLVPPDVDAADLKAAVTDLANPAVSGPVTLVFAGSQVALAPRQYADLLSIVSEDGALALDVDSDGLAALVHPQAQDTEPVDATVALRDGAPAVVPAVAGHSYDAEAVTEAFLTGVTADGDARTVPVTGTRTKADFTNRDARGLGVTTPVSTFTVAVPGSVGPSFSDAVGRLNGTMLRPGDTFSFHGRVGSVSGSASRLATATWNAGFLAGLTDLARTAAPTYAAGLPAGRDAMVDAGTDLALRNDTAYGVLFSARVAAGSVVVDVWSTKAWEVTASTGAPYAQTPRTTVADASAGCVNQPGADGFSVDLVRTFTSLADPAQTRSDTVTTTYQPEPAVVCQAPVRESR
jgi:vancomycin resistance protein YoaR